MEAIKIEISLPAEFLQKLEASIQKAVLESLRENVEAIRSEKINLTRKEAAARLKISLPTLDKLLSENKLQASTVKGRILIPESSIENLLKQSA
jgi:excisionase family DNA binding protein